METGMNIAGYRAMLDQEKMIDREEKQKISKPARWNKWAHKALIINSLAIAFMVSVIMKTEPKETAGSLSLLIINICTLASFASVFAVLGTQGLIVKHGYNAEKAKKVLWGNKLAPQKRYRYDECLDEFEIYLKFTDKDDLVYLGRVNANDELAENCPKKPTEKD